MLKVLNDGIAGKFLRKYISSDFKLRDYQDISSNVTKISEEECKQEDQSNIFVVDLVSLFMAIAKD